MKFFSRNIDTRGRMARAVYGVVLLAAGWTAHAMAHDVLATALVLLGGFGCLEAARGWCFVRACGIKTRF